MQTRANIVRESIGEGAIALPSVLVERHAVSEAIERRLHVAHDLEALPAFLGVRDVAPVQVAAKRKARRRAGRRDAKEFERAVLVNSSFGGTW